MQTLTIQKENNEFTWTSIPTNKDIYENFEEELYLIYASESSFDPILIITYNTNLTYDANGNLIKGLGKYYEYDSFNQLSSVRKKNATGELLARYSYDHEGNRIKQVEYNKDGAGNNLTTYYISDNFIQTRNTNGTIINETYYYANDKLVAKKDNSGTKTFYHSDHLGSTSLVTNQSGHIVEEEFYLPFGDVYSGAESNRFLHAGQEFSNLVNLYLRGIRYYEPSNLFRFIQPDNTIPDIYNPQDLNRYSYVRNNPYKYVDPSGESPLLVAGGVIVGYSLAQGVISGVSAYRASGGSYSDAGKYFAAGAAEGFVKSGTFVGGVYLAVTTTGGAALSEAGLLGYAASAAGTGARESVLNKLYGTSNQININDLMESAIDPTPFTLDNEFRFENSDPYADPDRRLSENEYLTYQQNQLTYQSYANQNDVGRRNPNLFQTPNGATPGGSGSSGGGSSGSGGSGGSSGCGFTMSCGSGCGSFMSCGH
ncbi:MAG: RHS repeat-associated core domain-containing protein [Nanoarchaeota archaeon]